MKSPQDMKIIQIEITNGCVNRCSNCTRFCGHHKKPFFMGEETFQKAVDSMQGFNGIVGVMGGEPTLHPKFAQFVDYFRTHFGNDTPVSSFREPTKDFIRYVVKNVFDITHHNQRGLWSSVGPKYAQHFERIQDTFGFQALNDHTNPSMHEALLVTRKELGVPDDEWMRLRDACWIQNIWSASITPKGAFFCEIAASLDMLLDGPGGWPIEPGWWKRQPEDFGDQLHWCELCSAPLAMPKRDAREGVDDVSPVWYEKLSELNSPKLKKGHVHRFDVANYRATDHQVINESLPYLHNHLLRIGENNKAIFPRKIAVVLQIPNGADPDDASRLIQENRRNVELTAVLSDNPSHQQVAETEGIAFVNSSSPSAFEELKQMLSSNDWTLLLNNAVASASILSSLGSLVFNPGCLYVGRDSAATDLPSSEKSDDSGFLFFNFDAIALQNGANLCDLNAAYPSDKVVSLKTDLNRKVRIYLSYHDDTVKIQNDIFTPIHVGKALSEKNLGILGDDVGDNISDKNIQYAELTAQYWAWKNDLDSDYLGFMHYRRVFIFKPGHEAEINHEKDRVILPGISASSHSTYGWREVDILEAMEDCDILLPLPYDVTSGCSCKGKRLNSCLEHCVNGHGRESTDSLLELIEKHYPEYRDYTEEFFAQDKLHLCNMFIMRRDLFEDYSAWLFEVLDKYMQIEDSSRHDAYQIRMPAFMAERLLNIYVRKLVAENPCIRVKQVPYAFIRNTTSAPKPIAALTGEKPVVPVVTAFDAKYAPFFGAFLASMLEHVSESRRYDIIIMEDDVSSDQKRMFETMIQGRSNVGVRYINMAGTYYDEGVTRAHFTKSAFNRLMLPELLPEHAKVVYIDPDTILLRDIADLFDHDIHDVYAGVVLDYTFKFIVRSDMRVSARLGGTTVKEYWQTYLQLSESAMAGYFNSGVMVLNLEKHRSDDLSRAFERLYREKPYYCPDQDILNKTFDGCVLHVDPRWNMITQPLGEMKHCPYHLFKEYEETRTNPYVLHYAGGHLKPWNNPKMDFAEFFWQYCRQTPFYEAILFDAMKGVRPKINLNGQSLTHYAKALKATVGATLHKVSPSLHAHCSRFYHRIRG